MRLRGYDEYEVTLGDEMRGERASLGKTLSEAERDLRIKESIVRAIEDCDLDGFPNDSVVAGYVRSYARYLGLDPDECYRRFCAESGFRSPSSAIGIAGERRQSGLPTIMAASAAIGGGLTQSRFAVKSAPVNMGTRISLGGLTSSLALITLIAGLGYGGYALLQDIQRVGFSPQPDGQDTRAEAPLLSPPQIEGGLLRRPDADVYTGGGALAAAPSEPVPSIRPSRDGPIADLDPDTSGIYKIAKAEAEPAPSKWVGGSEPSADPRLAGPSQGSTPAAAPASEAIATGPPTVKIHATNAAWVRVRDGDAAIVFEGTLQPGDQFELPRRLAEPMLRTGNAGAVYVLIDGTAYGPVGGSGRVVKNMSLSVDHIAEAMPQVSADAIGVAPGNTISQRAEAHVGQ